MMPKLPLEKCVRTSGKLPMPSFMNPQIKKKIKKTDAWSSKVIGAYPMESTHMYPKVTYMYTFMMMVPVVFIYSLGYPIYRMFK